MKVNKLTIDKITKAFELMCPMFDNELITEAFIVGSVAKGTARPDSDIDIMLINPNFETSSNYLSPGYHREHIRKISQHLANRNIKSKFIEHKNKELKLAYGNEGFWYQLYVNEIFHIMPQQESESIKKGGEYIEITKDLCNEVN